MPLNTYYRQMPKIRDGRLLEGEVDLHSKQIIISDPNGAGIGIIIKRKNLCIGDKYNCWGIVDIELLRPLKLDWLGDTFETSDFIPDPNAPPPNPLEVLQALIAGFNIKGRFDNNGLKSILMDIFVQEILDSKEAKTLFLKYINQIIPDNESIVTAKNLTAQLVHLYLVPIVDAFIEKRTLQDGIRDQIKNKKPENNQDVKQTIDEEKISTAARFMKDTVSSLAAQYSSDQEAKGFNLPIILQTSDNLFAPENKGILKFISVIMLYYFSMWTRRYQSVSSKS